MRVSVLGMPQPAVYICEVYQNTEYGIKMAAIV